MTKRNRRASREIVASQSGGITVLSSPLVLRGLREFSQPSRWTSKQVFPEPRPSVGISPLGYVATYSPEPRALSQRIEIYDIELTGAPAAISVPDEPLVAHPDFPAPMAWSATGDWLVAASGTWQPELHFFDARGKKFLGRFGGYHVLPRHLCWSGSGKYFAAAADGAETGSLQLWMAGATPEEFERLGELNRGDFAEEAAGEDLGDQGQFWGFGTTAFRPDEKALATVLEYEGEWADDAIVLARVPTLETLAKFDAAGQVSDLSWSHDARKLIFCASGQVYALDPTSSEVSAPSFAAEMCSCHPMLPLCAFFNSWLRSSAKGRVFIAELHSMTILDECCAEGVLGLRWSRDGHTLYAVSQDGIATLFERPLP